MSLRTPSRKPSPSKGRRTFPASTLPHRGRPATAAPDFRARSSPIGFEYFQHAAAVGQRFVAADGINKNGYNFGDAANGADGYGIALGVSAPVLGGTAKAHVGYMDAEGSDDSAQDVTRWNVAVGYDYALSKRTSLYTAAA